jgi:hypothetical protein
LTIEPSDAAARPEVTVEALPAILTAADIARVLQVSRPIAYDVLHQCKPFAVGRLQRITGESLRTWLETQR